jgi:hypothetical protein
VSVRIIIGFETGDSREVAVLYDSVTGIAFGPVFEEGEDGESSEDRALRFLEWLDLDARSYAPDEVMSLYREWVASAR